MIGIYKITNKINNKVYIGQSINIEKRWSTHRSHSFNSKSKDYNCPLYRAIRKYGLDNFIFGILEECSQDLLNEREQFYIKKYNSNNSNFGYNLTKGGQSNTVASKLSKKEILQIYDLLANTNLSEEQIAKQFNVSQRLVSGLNIGESSIQIGYEYPIRKHKIIIHKNNFCRSCGKEISQQATYCIECQHLLSRTVERPSRTILKEEIRTIPFVQLGKKYKVTDNTIRKWCKFYNLPYKKSDIKQISDIDWLKI